MDSRDKQVEKIFDSLHHLPKTTAPENLYSKIEEKISYETSGKSNNYWQYAAAILIAFNTLAYLVIKPIEDSQEITSQYDDYIENYNWSQNNYYEYLTVSE